MALVISPLLALMRDQLQRLPPCLPAAMLWGGQPAQEAQSVLQGVRAGALKVLFVAPERLYSNQLMDALQAVMPLSLVRHAVCVDWLLVLCVDRWSVDEHRHVPTQVCIDEAHCVTEWGHAFRPAYYRVGHALSTRLRTRCVLGLTATATATTQRAVAQVLGIPQDCVLRAAMVRDNLRLQVLRVHGGMSDMGSVIACVVVRRVQALPAGGNPSAAKSQLLALFRGQLQGCASAIVYCTLQAATEEVAKVLYAQGITAVAYHAGKPLKVAPGLLVSQLKTVKTYVPAW